MTKLHLAHPSVAQAIVVTEHARGLKDNGAWYVDPDGSGGVFKLAYGCPLSEQQLLDLKSRFTLAHEEFRRALDTTIEWAKWANRPMPTSQPELVPPFPW